MKAEITHGEPEKGIVINIDELILHIHLQERTDYHNFYLDGTGGLSEDRTHSEDKHDEDAEFDYLVSDLAKSVMKLAIQSKETGR